MSNAAVHDSLRLSVSVAQDPAPTLLMLVILRCSYVSDSAYYISQDAAGGSSQTLTIQRKSNEISVARACCLLSAAQLLMA